MDRRNFFNWLGVGIVSAPAVVKAVIETRQKATPIIISGYSLGGISSERLCDLIAQSYIDSIAQSNPYTGLFSNDHFR